MIICDRKNGQQRVLVMNLSSGSTHPVFLPEESCSVHPVEHCEFDSSIVRLRYTSPVTPWCLYEYDMESRNLRREWQQDVIGYDPTRYVVERVHAIASDSTRIPITLIYRKGLARTGRNPLLLHGYGAFASVAGVTSEFNPDLVSLLDEGFVFAEAHIRGNGVMGWDWYEQGRLTNKMNTFTDFIECAEYLISQGYTSKDNLAIAGSSAGGLLMGVVVNMRPDLAKVVVADVPLVDLLNVMTDDKLAIGSSFVEEFGDPYDKPAYDLMRAYSPYENVSPGRYPDMLVTASWNDVWVPYWGPAKWVAKLRAKKTDDNLLLLLTSKDQGHSGPTDRLGLAKWHSLMYAFLIDRLGAGESPTMHASDGRSMEPRKF
jgi:oligopeptidase B